MYAHIHDFICCPNPSSQIGGIFLPESRSGQECRPASARSKHLYLPSLIPGVQVDAGQDWVEYVFADGDHWCDSGVNKTAKVEEVEEFEQFEQFEQF